MCLQEQLAAIVADGQMPCDIDLAQMAEQDSDACISCSHPLVASLVQQGLITVEQQSLLQSAIQQQQQRLQQDDAWFDSDSNCSEDSGIECNLADEGLEFSTADEGLFDVPTLDGAADSSSGAQWYKDHLNDQLWTCGDAAAKLRLHEAIYMLLSWKSDFCVRDKAFAALLGMLTKLLLPEVGTVHACTTIALHQHSPQYCC